MSLQGPDSFLLDDISLLVLPQKLKVASDMLIFKTAIEQGLVGALT